MTTPIWGIIIGALGLIAEGLYYGILPGGDRINWWVAPIRSPALDKWLGGGMAVGFTLILVLGIVHAVGG